jgi:two-component system, NtrC family, sensor kinase
MTKGKSRKQLRESRELIESKQRHLQRSEVELFAAGIAHEFNNVLGAALGHAEWALDSKEPSDMKEALEVVIKACERAREITWALKGLAQPREERIGSLSLETFLGEISTWAKPYLAQDQIDFVSKKVPDLQLQGDADQLKEILINLVKNARDSIFTLSGNKKIVLSASHDDDFVYISVFDSGSGVAPEFRELIFQPFFTTKGTLAHVVNSKNSDSDAQPPKLGGGMGLGLYMARNAALEHGGDLTLGAKPSEFILKLPR